MRKHSILLMVMLCAGIMLCSCGGSSSKDKSNQVPSRISLDNSKALFVGAESELYAKMSLPDKIHAAIFNYAYAESTNTVLYQVKEDGTVEIVPILDAEGEEIPVTVNVLKSVGPKIIGMSLTAGGLQYQVAGDLTDGKLYNLGSTVDISNIYQGTTDDEIIVISNQVLQKISLQDLTVTPLSNPDALKINTSALNAAGGYNGGLRIYDYNYPVLIRDGKILANTDLGYKLFNPAGGVPVSITGAELGLWNWDFERFSSILSNGRVYNFESSYADTGIMQIRFMTPETLTSGGVLVPGSDVPCSETSGMGSSLLHIQHNYLPHEGNRLVISKYGYVKVNMEVDGTLSYAWTTKDLLFLFSMAGDICARGNVVYGLSSDKKSIMKADVVNDSVLTSLCTVTKSEIVKFWFAGDTLFYTAYAANSGTVVETYKIIPGVDGNPATSELVSSSEMEMGQIVEFTL